LTLIIKNFNFIPKQVIFFSVTLRDLCGKKLFSGEPKFNPVIPRNPAPMIEITG
jgi:hypothetical protein